MNIPIIITFSRILLIPIFILVVSTKPLLGTIIFLLAILTDIFDGYIARKSKQVTKLGMLLDPLADKLLTISALIVLVDMGFIEAWIAIVIIAREFIVTGLRIVALSKDIIIPAEMGGKIKTTAQFVSIVILLLDRSLVSLDLYTMGIALLWFAMFVGIASGIQYFVLFWKRLT
ncbi:MAG: CDP-diacylglycerol--glycerol-3-phosphate 3-phosphatidyltransferase [Thermodesulfovibrionia bacterium]|nr:CDP-diacylglycerol--glycerol-3-phosphate 3-phosphatidyltransferase [Thermodesulfovibrionia bacterium]MCK5511276.1 CDP-diacylglycerol--glycerol-3-phosphate 3-phosphatidyltransferase [Thermodesulfovibrionia bacterium]